MANLTPNQQTPGFKALLDRQTRGHFDLARRIAPGHRLTALYEGIYNNPHLRLFGKATASIGDDISIAN